MPRNAAVAEVQRHAIAEGTGMMSELCRLQLTYEPQVDGPPASLIAKYPSGNPTNRQMAMSYNLYEREVRYFTEIDPLTTAKSPTAYFTQLEGDNFIILMEDMGDYRVGDQTIGATLAEAEAAMDELAKLHTPFWENVGDLGWIPHIANSYHATNMHDLAHRGWDNMVSIFGDFIPDHIAAMKSDLLASIAPLQALMDSPPITLVHGDFRMANLLYGVAEHHHPLVIIDWQGPLLGRGLCDVALFLGQSVQTEIRRHHERALLNRYLDGLRRLGVDYPSDEAWHHYRLAQLYSWAYVVVVAGVLDASDEQAFAWMSQMIQRQVATTDDLGVRDLLPYGAS